jgi:hypothetical protein
MQIKGKRILKNGVMAGYVKQLDGSWKWRFISGPKKKRGGTKKYLNMLNKVNSNGISQKVKNYNRKIKNIQTALNQERSSQNSYAAQATNLLKSFWTTKSEKIRKNITIDSLVKLKQEVEQKLNAKEYNMFPTISYTATPNLQELDEEVSDVKKIIDIAISNRWKYYYEGFLYSPRLQECLSEEGFLRVVPSAVELNKVMSKISGEGLPVEVYTEKINDCRLYASVLKKLLQNTVCSHHDPAGHFAKFSSVDAPEMKGNIYTVENEGYRLSIERRFLGNLMTHLINPILNMNGNRTLGVDGIARMLSQNVICQEMIPPAVILGNVETNVREIVRLTGILNTLFERMIEERRGGGGNARRLQPRNQPRNAGNGQGAAARGGRRTRKTKTRKSRK